jgi:hypothetical protein
VAGKEVHHVLDPDIDNPMVADNVDTNEVPSAAWGWSGESRKTMQVAGWVVVVILLAMMIGNHHGHVEDLFLIGFAALIAVVLIYDMVRRRKER